MDPCTDSEDNPMNVSSEMINQSSELVNISSRIVNKWTVENFELGKKLGKGKFGNVLLAREKDTKLVFALKILFKRQLMDCKFDYQREIEIHSCLNHQNILHYYGNFHDDEHIYLILEYANKGDLFTHLTKAKYFSEFEASKYLYAITKGLQYLHSKSIIHRDIKPENILITEYNSIKIADFGCSFHLNDLEHDKTRICGTLYYLSPEMILRKSYNHSVDIWSLGILMYEFLFGKPPYDADTNVEIYDMIVYDKPSFPFVVSDNAINLIKGLLRKRPRERLTIEQILDHEWFSRVSELYIE